MKHHEKAKLARDHYESLTGVRPAYPVSAVKLDKLILDIRDIITRARKSPTLPKFPLPFVQTSIFFWKPFLQTGIYFFCSANFYLNK